MRVIVTRPEAQARRWADELSAQGLQAVVLPLIIIAAAPDVQAVRDAWSRLSTFDAVMFVSANAVEQFMPLRPPSHALWPPEVTAWGTGPGTAEALRRAGWAAQRVVAPDETAEQFDSETLWHLVQPGVRAGGRVLIVRGADDTGRVAGRDWLARQLDAAGVTVEAVAAYQRRMPVLSPLGRALASDAARDGSVWLFGSSQAIDHLLRLLPGEDWSRARAVATHARIAQAARAAGFGVVCESRGAVAEIAASIKSLR